MSGREAEGLQRRFGALSLTGLTVGLIVGSGIFRSPAEVAALAGSPTIILLAWAAGGIVTLCLGLGLAELAAMFPRVGGLYIYLEESFGRPVAFVFGWTFLIINPANWAAVALIAAAYLGALLPMEPEQERAAATAMIAIVALINTVSVDLAVRFNGIVTGAKALALAAIAGVILLAGVPHASLDDNMMAPAGFSAFGMALVAVLWPYEGVAAASAMAGEVRDPGRNAPRGLIGGVLVVTILYLVINLAYLAALTPEQIAGSRFIAADAMRAAVGDNAATLVTITAVIAVAGALLAAATCDPRVIFTMARDRLFFASVGKVHPRLQTPHVAVLASALLAMLYIWVRTFEELATQFVLGMWLFYALCMLGLIRLRITRPTLPRPYRMPLYPLLPILFVLAALGLLVNALIALPFVSLANLALVAVGFPIYWIWERMRRPAEEAEA